MDFFTPNLKKVLVTCPPMIKQIERYREMMKKEYDMDVYYPPNMSQTLSQKELLDLVPHFDGWIIGDDETNYDLLKAGIKGRLKGCIKWGVGTDNIDYRAFKELGIPISNTPNMFGNEVADIAIGYLICLARKINQIDIQNKLHYNWFKPCGMSLTNRKVAVIGFGDIGKHVVERLMGFRVLVGVTDPQYIQDLDGNIYCGDGILLPSSYNSVKFNSLEETIKGSDFIISTCCLNASTKHLLNKKTIKLANRGVNIINVSRGGVLKEDDVYELLKEGFIGGLGLDVFEEEPFTSDNRLREFNDRCIWGSHNSSNTLDAVDRTSIKAIKLLDDFLSKQNDNIIFNNSNNSQ